MKCDSNFTQTALAIVKCVLLNKTFESQTINHFIQTTDEQKDFKPKSCYIKLESH